MTTFREKLNRPGIFYNEEDKTHIYLEDFIALENAINLLEARVTALEPIITTELIPVMTDYNLPSGLCSSSNEIGTSYVSWKAFQNLFPTDFEGWATVWLGFPEWLQYEFVTSKIVIAYSVTSRNEGGNSRVPKSWTFEGSNNNVDFDVLDTQNDVVDWASEGNIKKTFNITNTTAYLYYRLNINASNDVSYVGVGTLQMYE